MESLPPVPMDTASTTDMVEFANDLADAARKVILPYWRKPIHVESKVELRGVEQESPVTIADKQAERQMRDMIERRYPGHGIYGEEHGNVRTEAEFVWVLDPIDGTKSFITGKPLFGTLIALLHHGRPVIGIVDQCVLDERWVGVRGRDTTLNGKIVKTSGVESLGEAMLYATTPHMFAAGWEAERFAAMCEAVKRPLYGADCYAYALVASGFGADLVVEADLGLYDYCALVPVVEGAGGRMTAWDGKELSLQHHTSSRGRVVAASNPKLHAEALVVLQIEPSSLFHRACRSPLVALGVGLVIPKVLASVLHVYSSIKRSAVQNRSRNNAISNGLVLAVLVVAGLVSLSRTKPSS